MRYNKRTQGERTVTVAQRMEIGYCKALISAANSVIQEVQTKVKVLPSQANYNRKSMFVPPCRGKGAAKVG